MRARISIAVIVGVALFGAACGSKAPGQSQLTSIKLVSAARKTVAAKTSRVAMSFHLADSSGAPGAAFDFSGTGLFDYAGRKGTLEFSFPNPATGTDVTFEAIFVGNVIYEKLPALATAQLPTAKPWIRIDLSEVSESSGVNFGALSQTSSSDPSHALQYLLGAASDATKVGTETVRGAHTTHYRLTLDLNKAAQRLPEQARPSYKEITQALGQSTLPAEAWVDDQGLVRKIEMMIDLSKSSVFGGKGVQLMGTLTETVEFFDFGVPVEVSPPPDSETTDFRQLLAGLASPTPYTGSG
jgi:hypothetical protein